MALFLSPHFLLESDLNSSQQLLQIMYRALNTPHGLKVLTTNPKIFKQRFYALRSQERDKGNLAFENLSPRTPPGAPDNEVWLINAGDPSLAEENQRAANNKENSPTVSGGHGETQGTIPQNGSQPSLEDDCT